MSSKITVALDWTPNGNHLGFFVAKDKGLYDAAGLDVTIVSPADAEYDGSYNPGDPDADAPGAPKYVTPCSKLADGTAHFAINSPEGVVGWNTAPGRPKLKAVAALLRDRNSSAIVALRSSGIRSPKDLDGKRYASYAARFEGRIVQRMIQHDGGKGDFVEDTPPMLGIWNTLLEGKSDATWVFMQWEGVEAKLKGVELEAFPVCDYGMPYAYAPCLCAHPDWLAKNGDVARAFAAEQLRGVSAVVASAAFDLAWYEAAARTGLRIISWTVNGRAAIVEAARRRVHAGCALAPQPHLLRPRRLPPRAQGAEGDVCSRRRHRPRLPRHRQRARRRRGAAARAARRRRLPVAAPQRRTPQLEAAPRARPQLDAAD